MRGKAMEVVSVKFQEDILKKIDKSIALHNFNSRTEFIREAVRGKLSDLEREQIAKEFMKLRGTSKKKTTDEDLERIREEVSKEYLEKYSHEFK
jgi:metal-responsive CopG/Arc/MetJ family transcriptional regulator